MLGLERTSRTGKTYSLHVKTTVAGKQYYFFSMNAEGPQVEKVPDGYEVYENVNGQVFLRKKAPLSERRQRKGLPHRLLVSTIGGREAGMQGKGEDGCEELHSILSLEQQIAASAVIGFVHCRNRRWPCHSTAMMVAFGWRSGA